MSGSYEINFKLPPTLLKKMKDASAQVLPKQGKESRCSGYLPLYVLQDGSEKPDVKLFLDFLEGNKEVDPLVHPHFGPPLQQWVTPAVQHEVHFLLYDFSQKLRHDLAPLASPQNGAAANWGAAAANYQYHAQIALHRVQQEIEHPTVYAGVCPNLVALPVGNVICDLTITYANCAVQRRIRII